MLQNDFFKKHITKAVCGITDIGWFELIDEER